MSRLGFFPSVPQFRPSISVPQFPQFDGGNLGRKAPPNWFGACENTVVVVGARLESKKRESESGCEFLSEMRSGDDAGENITEISEDWDVADGNVGQD